MAKPMNILMILADQHQAGMLGCAGHPQVLTPHLDRLAATGVRFAQAYTQNTICTPSRVSILSGQYCHNHGFYALSGPAPSGLGQPDAALSAAWLPDGCVRQAACAKSSPQLAGP